MQFSNGEDFQEFQEVADPELGLQEEEEFKMEGVENFVSVRGKKIENINKSLGLVNKMYQNLNEIVDQ